MAILPPKKFVNNKNDVSIWHMDVSEIIFRTKKTAKLKDIAIFCRKLSFLLDSGISIKASMSVLCSQIENRGLSNAIGKLHSLVEQGESLSLALTNVKVFPLFLCGYASIGEKTGKLAEVFAKLANYYEEHAKIEEELAAAMVYPIMVAIMMLGVIILSVTLVLPGYADIFINSDIPMPRITSGLISASDFVSHNLVFIVCGFLLLIAFAKAFFKSETGNTILTAFKLKIPLVKKSINLKIAESLSLLLYSGISIQSSIPICVKLIDSKKIKKDFRELESDLRRGKPFWISLNKLPYVDKQFINLVKIGEESGSLTKTVSKCSDYLLADYKLSIRQLNKLVEPIVTLVLGIMLAIIMLAVVLPTFELAGVM